MNSIKLRAQTLLKYIALLETESQTNRIETKPFFFCANIKKLRQIMPSTTKHPRVGKQ